MHWWCPALEVKPARALFMFDYFQNRGNQQRYRISKREIVEVKNPKVSIIMPVYGVEDYVGKTIKSVLSQTLTDFEFFAIDDGSKDNSGKICDEYAAKDSRLKVIHKENGGAPEARNVAIKQAKGEYLYFIDSDDWIENDYLEKMYNLAKNNNADVVITGFFMEYYQNGKDVTYETNCDDTIYTSEDFKQNAHKYLNNSLLSLPWNKLYRAKRIHEEELLFPNTKWDDHHFNMDFLMNVDKNVVLSSMKKYHWYRSRKGSETMINYSDPNLFNKRKEHFEHVQQLYKHWGVNNEEAEDSINSYYMGRVIQCIQEACDNKKLSKKERKALIRQIVNDKSVIEAQKKAKSLSIKFKIAAMPVKLKNVTLATIEGKMISALRSIAPGMFIKMKEGEVHG